MNRSICFLKQSQLCWMVSWVIIWRMSVRPEGSPIMAGAAADEGDGLVARHLQPLHQAECHEVTHMEGISGGVEANIEGGLAAVDRFR